MFDLFKKDKESGTQDVKIIRDRFLSFIKEQLKKVEGGEGNNIKGLHIFISCTEEEKHVYESALYFEEEDRFKDEVQRIADDYAIDLPESWTMETSFVEEVPTDSMKIPDLNAALFIQTRKRTLVKSGSAVIRILGGEAEQGEYKINSASGKVTIGREKSVQTGEGFFRENTIAFPGDKANPANKFVSRQHAHVEWNNETGAFILFADEGGIPPKNKIKVHTADGKLFKLQSMEIGYQLKDGDQVILGDSAVLQFNEEA
jgi:hypothetical protein